MQAWLSDDDKKDHAIPRDGNGIKTDERDGDPSMRSFQARDTRKEEGSGVENALIEGWHDEWRGQISLEERIISCNKWKKKVYSPSFTQQFSIMNELCPIYQWKCIAIIICLHFDLILA